MSSKRFDGHEPTEGTDTGGVPWSGRTLLGTGFDADAGAAEADVLAALDHRSDEKALVAAIAAARLIVPVVAVAGETTEVNGLVTDASSDMAAVTLQAPTGEKALPAFTSMAALAAWDSSARPVPVTAQRAALAAVQEGCGVIVIDLAGRGDESQPAPVALRSSMVWALAMNRTWLPAHEDEHVQSAVDQAIADESDVFGATLGLGQRSAVQIALTLKPNLASEQIQQIVTRIGERLATDGEVRARIDAISFKLND